MTKVYTFLLFLTLTTNCFAQAITGKVINASTKEPLCYATIGVIDTNSGTITDEKGNFKLDAKILSAKAQVRISMIGFEAQVIPLKKLLDSDTTLLLKESITQLSEVIIKPRKDKGQTIGTKATSKKNVTGWGGCGNCGEDLGGIERGLRINLSKAVYLENVNFHVAYFGFDSMIVRFHIRDLKNDYPDRELLKTNIYATIKSDGWHEIDLRSYNLSFSQDIAVSIEWVKAWGKTKDKENSLKFSVGLLKGTLFAKDGSEGRWDMHKNVSPGIYLTVEELGQ